MYYISFKGIPFQQKMFSCISCKNCPETVHWHVVYTCGKKGKDKPTEVTYSKESLDT